MLIDGEKWACDACVRGHRVSNCNHYERPLTHINKKGRPVSQCPHCRGLRKARSSHVKCECGDKPHTKSDCSSPEKHGVKHGQSPCCCSHGNRCTCSHKKEHLSAITEKKPQSLMRSRSQTDANKPHFQLMQGDGNLTVFQNGHHKPIHHRNLAGHECGMPYKIPRPHSIHGNSIMAQSSTDSLPLLSTPYDMFVQDDRMARSEHGSPALPPKVDMLNQLPQLDLSYGAISTDIASTASSPLPEELAQPPMSGGAMSYFSGVDDQPLSAMSGPPVDWGNMGLPLDNGGLSVEYSQARSYTSYEQPPTSHPGLGPSSSGDISDTEDYLSSMQSPALYCSSPFPHAENNVMGAYNMSSDSLVSTQQQQQQQQPPPTSVPMSASLNPAMEPFMGGGVASPPDFSEYAPSPQLDQEPFGKPAMALHDMQKLAHPGLGIEAARGHSPPNLRPTSDPSWAGHGSYTPEEANFMPTSAGFQPQASWASC